ncbi:DUF5662 family protein [Mesobacillus sp. AQ2]|uniref:DUF5662 family protein n=1 Tax=Mesobacillus sp. AQ2 TaxID=3043332 RepID=UPI0024C17049|nr:DUF5662 family protein [Mesobacillus sp. AQ2]WHX42787.1 DUF5662 family protein [Mesobacillus sp. AQ2]
MLVRGTIHPGYHHDLSKFYPREFFPYARKFYSEKKLSVEDELRWRYAWLTHQHKNKHHWEYWVIDPNKNRPCLCHENTY